MTNALKYNCIFGGGAVRGISYVGVIKALRELEIEVDSVAGSSVGAVFAAFYALGFSCQELKDIFFEFNFNIFKDINIGFGPDFAFSKGEVFLNWLKDLIEEKYYGNAYIKGQNKPVTFADLDSNICILTSDLNNNVPVVFSKVNTPDFEVAMAVRISAGLPGLMKPTSYKDGYLVDGDLIKSWPLWKTDDELCKKDSRVLEFRLEGCKERVSIKNPLDYLNCVFSTFSNFCTENVIKEFSQKDKFDYIVIDTKDVLLIDFSLPPEKRAELIDTGYNTTISYFTQQLVEKKKLLLPYYVGLLKELNILSSLINSRKILEAKNKLYQILADLYEPLQYIDTCFFKELSAFKDSFLANFSKSLFFNNYKLNNFNKNIDMLNSTISKVEFKVNELKEYIDTHEK